MFLQGICVALKSLLDSTFDSYKHPRIEAALGNASLLNRSDSGAWPSYSLRSRPISFSNHIAQVRFTEEQ
jgi:hypothetical protein